LVDYRAVCGISEHADDELKRRKEMCSLIRDVDKNIEFGLHFVVSDYDRKVFMRFVDSFSGLQAEGDVNLRPEYVRAARHLGEQMLTSSTSGICYTYWTVAKGNHELWMFGTLTKLDWSKFSFEFPRSTTVQANNDHEIRDTDEELDPDLDS
jgi:hypothetical protein